MKKIQILPILSIFIGTLLPGLFSGCGEKDDNFPWLVGKDSEIDQENEEGLGATDISVLEQELRGAIPHMLDYSTHAYQYLRTNSIDNYAGYWTTSQNNFLFGGPLPTLYTYPNNYLGGPMNNEVFRRSKNAIFHASELGKPEWRAVALIIQGYVGHEVTDFYGAIPFQDWRAVKRTSPLAYEKGSDVYDRIFLDLREAVSILKERRPSAEELGKIEVDPLSLGQGDWRRWVKFANSIRLRMALNIVKANPSKAREEAESAVNDEIGVFDERADQYDMGYYYSLGNTGDHALYSICNSWLDIRLGASLENILKRYDNPLLGIWFNKNSNPINTSSGTFSGIGANQDYIGIRQGVAMINKSNEKQGYGPFSTATLAIRELPKNYLKRAEVLFLRAEGALRGWNMGGSAREFYERGIRLAFSENGFTDDSAIRSYLERESVVDVDYTDPYAVGNSIKGRVTAGVKWNEGDSDELKLEKIVTQKYIANFPMGAEAWTTFRRTGYPRLFPVKLNNMPGVDTELQIRRIPLVETTNNSLEIQSSLIPALGGPNNGGTRLFWDVPTEGRGEVLEPGSNSTVVVPVNF